MNKKHLAAAFAVFAATTMSFSAFAASVDANARAYERAAAEHYTYAAPQAATYRVERELAEFMPEKGFTTVRVVGFGRLVACSKRPSSFCFRFITRRNNIDRPKLDKRD